MKLKCQSRSIPSWKKLAMSGYLPPSSRASASSGALVNGRVVSYCALLSSFRSDKLQPCRFCGRTFDPVRVGKHELVCGKIHHKKRPVFKSKEQRVPKDCLKYAQAQPVENTSLQEFFQNLLKRGSTGNANVAPSQRFQGASRTSFPYRPSIAPLERAPSGLSRAQVRNLQQREITPEDYELLLRLDETVEKKEYRLTEQDCDRLPLPLASQQWEGETCGVCLGDLDATQELRGLPCCSHVLHDRCIRQWLTGTKATCPLDTLEVRLD